MSGAPSRSRLHPGSPRPGSNIVTSGAPDPALDGRPSGEMRASRLAERVLMGHSSAIPSDLEMPPPDSR